jgi:sialic acid synthase SpsE
MKKNYNMDNSLRQDAPAFIAEVSSNHFQSLSRCKAFIDAAADIGCWGVKFQLFKIDELFSSEILEKSPAHRKRKKWELPASFIPGIAAHCRMRNIRFGCTPFYLDAVDELMDYVDFFKIASYELLWKELLTACAATGKPVMLSTGMATLEEVTEAVETILAAGCRDLTVFHCVSGYPAPASQCNLSAITTLKKKISKGQGNTDIRFGWSDHSVHPGVINRAVYHFQARVIEFHLDLDGKGEEYSSGHCWMPDQIGLVMKNIMESMEADGDGVKMPTAAESADCLWRADPSDGLRPFKQIRKQFHG